MSRKWPEKSGVMQVGGIPATDIAEQFDTPCYVLDAKRAEGNLTRLKNAFKDFAPVEIAYAAKANSSLALLTLFAKQGISVDVVSIGEAFLAAKAGFTKEKIYFTGTNPRDDELSWLIKSGVHINIDSVSMAQRLCKLTKVKHSFGVRINPGIGAGHHEHVNTGAEDTKFGVHAESIPELISILKQSGHRLNRLHAHIGSGILDPQPFLALIDAMAEISEDLRESHQTEIDTIDIGGGFGIPYQAEESPLDINFLATGVGNRFRRRFASVTKLIIEPGRLLVGDAEVILTRVNTIKKTPITTFVGTDAGFNTLLRPALYGSHHEIVAAEKMNQALNTHYTICGPICETGDILGERRTLPALQEGDLLAICDAGAYGIAMSSTYNSRPLPAEVMVINKQAELIRERGTMTDLLLGQIIPSALK